MKKFHMLLKILTILCVIDPIFAHGEDTPGPHGGFIRMPAAFHTEVISDKKGFKVILLDINFKHPTVKDSSVQAQAQFGKQTISLQCKPQADYFLCPLQKSWKQKKGRLDITAVREKTEGAVVSYPLPLS